MIANSLVTDPQAFKKLSIESPFTLRVRELSRSLDYLDDERRRLSNQLRDLLIRYFPAILTLCPAVDEPWLWALLRLALLPTKAKRLTANRLESLLKKHRVRRLTATDGREKRHRECLQVSPHSVAAIAEHVGILIPLIEAFDAQYRHVFKTLKAVVNQATSAPESQEHRTVALMRTLPGTGVVVSTTLLGEGSRVLAESNGRAFRCNAGVAPITKQSGKGRRVSMRYGCNERIREACYHWARTSVQRDAKRRSHYARLREAGHSHGRGFRGVCDRLITTLMAVLRTGIPYAPEIRAQSAGNGPPMATSAESRLGIPSSLTVSVSV